MRHYHFRPRITVKLAMFGVAVCALIVWGVPICWDFGLMTAAHALCRIGPEGRPAAAIVIPALIERLETAQRPHLRASAAEILADMGPAAGQAIPALRAAMGDREAEVRRAAQAALNALRAERPESGPRDSNISPEP
jgi:hypothetical protein